MKPALRYRIALAAVLAATGALFAPALPYPFLWDDTAVVRDNPFLHRPVPAGLFFHPDYWERLLPVSGFDFRPLQMLTLSAVSRAGGRNPVYYRAVNLALHLLVSGMVFRLAARLGTGKAAALAAAAFFAFHPVQVETVISARNISELVNAVIFFLVLGLVSRPGKLRLVSALLLYGAALLYKESALVFPALLTILLLFPKETSDRRVRTAAVRRTIPFWLLAAAGGAGKILLSPGAAPAEALPLFHYPAGAAGLLAVNLRLLLLPVRLRAVYDFPPPESWAQPAWFLALAGAAGAFLILLRIRDDRPLFPLLICLAAAILPSLVRLGQDGRTVAEQRLYLPSVFFCLAAGILVVRAGIKSGGLRGRAGRAAGPLICLCLIFLHRDYLRQWRGELPFWQRVTAAEPRVAVAFNNLGIALLRSGDSDGALAAWRRALELEPRLPEALTNLGLQHLREGRWEEAGADFRAALEAEPYHHPAAIYLAQTYLRLGMTEPAARTLEKVLEENPWHAEAANELAIARERQGRREEAVGLYREAAGLDPEYAAPLRNLAELYREWGKPELALEAGREAVEKRPDQPRGYTVLAGALIALGRLEEAGEVLREGLRRHPGNREIRSRLLALQSAMPD